MNAKIKLCTVLISLGLLSACVAATPYRQAEHSRDYGYQVQQIEQDRYRVTFAGNAQTNRQTVENYLLFRAAELTLANGHDYFVITSADTEKNTEQQSTVFGNPAFSLGYGHHHGYGHGYNLGFGFNILNSSYSDYEAFGVVLLKSGKKPKDDPNAYNAREVVENLGLSVMGTELRKLSSD